MTLATNSKHPLTDGFVMREYADRPGAPLTAAECLEFARSLERRLQEAERDAKRYRYLRDTAHPDSDDGLAVMSHEQNDWGNWYDKFYSGEELDAAIDVALSHPLGGKT